MRIRRILYLNAWHPTWCPVNVSLHPLGWWEWRHSLSTARGGSRGLEAAAMEQAGPPHTARWCPTVPWLPEGGAWELLPHHPRPGAPPAPAWPPGRRPARGWGSQSHSPAPPSRVPPLVGLGVCSACLLPEGALVSQDAADRGCRCAEPRGTRVRWQCC